MTISAAYESILNNANRYRVEIETGVYVRSQEKIPHRRLESRRRSLNTLELYMEILDRWRTRKPRGVGDLSQLEKDLVNEYEISDLFPGQFRYSPV